MDITKNQDQSKLSHIKHVKVKTDTFPKNGFPENPTALTTFEQSWDRCGLFEPKGWGKTCAKSGVIILTTRWQQNVNCILNIQSISGGL